MILLFYVVNELLSVETKKYECFVFAMIFLKEMLILKMDTFLMEANEDYFIIAKIFNCDPLLTLLFFVSISTDN